MEQTMKTIGFWSAYFLTSLTILYAQKFTQPGTGTSQHSF